MTAGVRHVAVVVPAADEERHIGGCLDAVARAADRLAVERPGVTVDVLVALDRCCDRTAEIVAAHGVHGVAVDHRCVGRARAAGTAAALHAVAGLTTRRVWLANTDADSRVPERWLAGQLDLADAGAGMVLGTVLPEVGAGAGPLLARWRALHDVRDGHPHVHGANLGVRADVLARLGGWPPLRTGEDVTLAARAASAGVVIARTGGLAVHTSARRRGRAPQGFSSYLTALEGG